MSEVYLNGEFVPEAEASISILDRGFIFGDGIYEVIPVYGGVPFRLEQHVRRLAESLRSVDIPNPLAENEWSGIVEELLKRNPGEQQSLYIQVTRGAAERDHVLSHVPRPTVLMSCRSISPREPEGVRAITSEDIRWDRCHIKTTSLIANVLLRRNAAQAGAYEAVLIRDGLLSEGAASNVFVVVDGVVKTPPLSERILAGVTRALLLELLRSKAVPCEEVDVSEAELRRAEEIWLTSSAREILPVTVLDGRPVGDGEIGSRWKQVWNIYQQFKRTHCGRNLQRIHSGSSTSPA